MKPSANVAASVRQRLLNRARSDKRPFNELLQYYAMERFLYRLSKSLFADRFILKGALLLRVWDSPEFRPTMDIDMLGKTGNEATKILTSIRNILAVKVEEDGLVFDSDSLQSEPITEDADYGGLRIRFRGSLDTARLAMQLDIEFGDVIYPGPEKAYLPTMLEYPAPKLLCYSRESVIAEKFEAMIKLGVLNSRMKDFFDIWLLSRQFNFIGADLAEAIRLTFERRKNSIPATIEPFSESFIKEKQIQWTAFLEKLKQDNVPSDFKEIVVHLNEFLAPIVAVLIIGKHFSQNWVAPGPWT
ncbi:MAG: nucleotidyl transferase AbiEii/AbiGii toxin family protein [Desulforhopalus sp.]